MKTTWSLNRKFTCASSSAHQVKKNQYQLGNSINNWVCKRPVYEYNNNNSFIYFYCVYFLFSSSAIILFFKESLFGWGGRQTPKNPRFLLLLRSQPKIRSVGTWETHIIIMVPLLMHYAPK